VKNEDGKIEPILGHGQLLGVFFILVILLALFFGMGYVMGRNSGSASSFSNEPPADSAPVGVYLQLAATTRHEAELEVDVLRKKNFHATSMEVPEKPGIFRVLVGPVADGGVNKAREDLQGAGFPGKSAIVKRF